MPWRLWPLIRDRHATLSEVFQRLFGDDEAVKLVLASNIAYYTDDPDTMPFVAFAIPQASYLLGGGHYVRGGSQVLSDRLVAIVREAGGEAEAGREVAQSCSKAIAFAVCAITPEAPTIHGGSCAGRVRKCRPDRARRHAARAGAPKVQRALSGPAPVNFIMDGLAWAQPPFA